MASCPRERACCPFPALIFVSIGCSRTQEPWRGGHLAPKEPGTFSLSQHMPPSESWVRLGPKSSSEFLSPNTVKESHACQGHTEMEARSSGSGAQLLVASGKLLSEPSLRVCRCQTRRATSLTRTAGPPVGDAALGTCSNPVPGFGVRISWDQHLFTWPYLLRSST